LAAKSYNLIAALSGYVAEKDFTQIIPTRQHYTQFNVTTYAPQSQLITQNSNRIYRPGMSHGHMSPEPNTLGVEVTTSS